MSDNLLSETTKSHEVPQNWNNLIFEKGAKRHYTELASETQHQKKKSDDTP